MAHLRLEMADLFSPTHFHFPFPQPLFPCSLDFLSDLSGAGRFAISLVILPAHLLKLSSDSSTCYCTS